MWTKTELDRYARQMILPGVGAPGQLRLKQASVLVVGAGGLGTPVLQYLAAAGVGRLGIAEMDQVDISNLQRQVMYKTQDVGQPKAEAAKAVLKALNPHIKTDIHPQVTAENALELFESYGLVVDCSDNFATRYLVSDACVLLGKPWVYGALQQFEGQVSVFLGKPCYRCLFPVPPEPHLVASCAEAGVLGTLPGVVGSLMATEALKLLLGLGQPLVKQLLVYAGLEGSFRSIRYPASPVCPACGDNPKLTGLQDYDLFCQLR
jgi:molybdopterin-synthase adenylyltransferase